MDLACSWSLSTRPEEVRRARRLAVAFARDAGLQDDVVGDVALVVSEAVTNAVQHAFHPEPADPAPTRILLAARSTHDRVDFFVSDNGRGLHRRPGSPGLRLGSSVIDLLAQTTRQANGPHGGAAVTMSFVRAPA